MNRYLLIVDPQNDFCSLEPLGALHVKGAEVDMTRLAELIDRIRDSINWIHVTLDTHRRVHIAHPIFWVNEKGEHPKPHTVISVEDVEKGVWKASRKYWQISAENYVKELAKKGRFVLVIWNPHCGIATWGGSIYPVLESSLIRWEENFNCISYITKGQNIFTEHYGAFEAEVPDPTDPSTLVNMSAINLFKSADQILIAGEALSFCVAETTRQLSRFVDPSKFILLSDCSSNVPGYEKQGEAFTKEMENKGMRICKSVDYLV